MPRVTSQQFAFYVSMVLHLALMVVLAWNPASTLWQMEFAGQRRAVSLSATFAEPVPLSEPEPVEFIMSETDAEQATIDIEPDADISRESREIAATVEKADLQVAAERETPPAPKAERRERKRQEEPVEPTERPLPRQERTVPVLTSAASPPIPAGTSEETLPEFTHSPAPAYPPEALRNGWKGEVVLRLTIDTEGRVTQVEVAQSSGHAILDEAALEAVRKWKGTPAKRDGQPVAAQFKLSLNFL